MQLYFATMQMCFKLPTQFKMTPVHIMSLSQNAIVFSVNGTPLNKRIKDALLLVLKAEYAYCIRFILQGKWVHFIQIWWHYFSGCLFVLNNHRSYLLKQFWHISIALVMFGSWYMTMEKKSVLKLLLLPKLLAQHASAPQVKRLTGNRRWLQIMAGKEAHTMMLDSKWSILRFYYSLLTFQAIV